MGRALWSGTLGDFAHDLLDPLLSPGTIQNLRLFFGTYVSGRGLLPAIRVGSQPYGVLVTSSLPLWTFGPDETADDAAFWNGMLARLRTLRQAWDAVTPGVPVVGQGGDPFATLLSVIGLQASSVEYYSRKAISHDYLANYTRFRGTPQAVATELWEEMQSAVALNLAAIGLNVPVPFRLRSLIFWREHDLSTGPVIDDDPRVPFSEERGIRALRRHPQLPRLVPDRVERRNPATDLQGRDGPGRVPAGDAALSAAAHEFPGRARSGRAHARHASQARRLRATGGRARDRQRRRHEDVLDGRRVRMSMRRRSAPRPLAFPWPII